MITFKNHIDDENIYIYISQTKMDGYHSVGKQYKNREIK